MEAEGGGVTVEIEGRKKRRRSERRSWGLDMVTKELWEVNEAM